MTTTLAPDTEMDALTTAVEADGEGSMHKLDAMLEVYAEDPRLHFLKGSLLAGAGRAIEAHRALIRAVELAPDFALARYQLGFFELTSGEPQRALSTWGPLLAEPEGNCLRKFVEGMTHLIRDEFSSAITRFEEGIRLNHDNEPMNRDIRLLIAECRKLHDAADVAKGEMGEHSATSLILGQFGGSKTIQ